MIVCVRCRNRNPDADKVCRFCGAPLPPAATPVVPVIPVHESIAPPEEREAPPPPPPVIPLERLETRPVIENPVVPVEPKPPLPPPQPPQPQRSWLSWILTALLTAGSGGGGYYAGSSTDNGSKQTLADLTEKSRRLQAQLDMAEAKVKEQSAQLALQQDQAAGINTQAAAKDAEIRNVRDQLSRAQTKLTAEVNARVAATHQLEVIQSQFTHGSGERQNQLAQMKQNLDEVQGRLKQTEARLAAATRDLAKAPEHQSAAVRQPKSGVLVWYGEVKKKRNVEIRDGQLRGSGSLAGSLPGGPVHVQAEDSTHVTISVAPSPDNHWNRIVFKVQGDGATTARLVWTAQ
jgi:hypothetical protein